MDTAGKLRFLTVRAVGPELVQLSGLYDSEKPLEHRTTCKPKNVGRANATTAEEQALKEAKAKIADKLKLEYFETILEAQTTEVIQAMLAKDSKDIKDFDTVLIDWTKPVFAQPKLDGMRALGLPLAPMMSREGTPITTMGHIQTEIDTCVTQYHLDGELYSHGRNFQENMRLIKKDRGAETKEIKYRVYDLIVKTMPFAGRYALLTEICQGKTNIELVPTYPIRNMDDLKRIHKKFLAEGYEGTMIRHGDYGYECGKDSDSLLKYKDMRDIACLVVDVLPADKNPDQGVVQCQIKAGVFGCGMKFSHTERREILKNKDQYIGKVAEVRFFEFSEEGIPRFPVCFGFRLDKTTPDDV